MTRNARHQLPLRAWISVVVGYHLQLLASGPILSPWGVHATRGDASADRSKGCDDALRKCQRKLHAELDKAPLDCALSSMKLHCKKREAKLQKLKQVGNLLCSFAQDLVHSEKVAKEYFSLPCSDPRTQPIATKDTSCPAADRTQQKLEAFHRKHDEAFYLPFSTTAKQFLAKTNAHQFQAVVVKNSGGGEADAAFVQFLKAQLRGGSQTGGGELYVLGRHLLAVRSFREEFSEKLRARIETNFLKHIDAGLCFGGEEWSWLEPDADSFSGAVEKIVRVSLDELDGSGGAAETDPQSFVFAQVLGKLQPIIKSNLGPWGAVNWLEQIKAIGGGSLDQPFSADAFQKEAVGQKDRMSEQQDKTEVSEVELEELANAILAKEEFSAFFGRLNGAGEGQGCGTGANAGLELPQGQPERQTEASAGKQPAPAEKEPETKCGAGSKAESKSDTVAKPQARGGAVSKPDAKGGAGSKADPTCATVSKPGASFGSGAKPDAKGGAGAKPNEKASAGAKIDSKYTATGSKPDARGGTGSKPGAKGSAGAKAASKRGIVSTPDARAGTVSKPHPKCGSASKRDAKSVVGSTSEPDSNYGADPDAETKCGVDPKPCRRASAVSKPAAKCGVTSKPDADAKNGIKSQPDSESKTASKPDAKGGVASKPDAKCGAASKSDAKCDVGSQGASECGAASKPDPDCGVASKPGAKCEAVAAQEPPRPWEPGQDSESDSECGEALNPDPNCGGASKPVTKCGAAAAQPHPKCDAGPNTDSEFRTASKPETKCGTGSKSLAQCGGAPKGDAKSSSGAKASAEKSAGSGAGAKPGGNLQDDPKRSGGSEHGAEQIGNYPKELGKRANEPDSADIGARGSKASAKQSSSMKDAEAGKLNKNPVKRASGSQQGAVASGSSTAEDGVRDHLEGSFKAGGRRVLQGESRSASAPSNVGTEDGSGSSSRGDFGEGDTSGPAAGVNYSYGGEGIEIDGSSSSSPSSSSAPGAELKPDPGQEDKTDIQARNHVPIAVPKSLATHPDLQRLVQLKGEQFALRFLMELYRRRQREAKSKSNAEGHATGTGVAGNQNQGSPKQPEEPKAACEKCLQRFKENGNTWPKVNTNEKDKDGKPKEKDLFCRPVSTSQCLEARERCRRGEQPPEAKSRNQAGGGVHGFGPDGKVESIDISK